MVWRKRVCTIRTCSWCRGRNFIPVTGAPGLLGLKDHLLLPGYAGYPNTAAASLYPMNADVYDMAHLQGALVGAVHPFDEVPDPFAKPAQQITDELPVDVALGKLDYMEIVSFSDHKSTAAVWYKLLNLGFKLPAGGGRTQRRIMRRRSVARWDSTERMCGHPTGQRIFQRGWMD